MERVLLKQFHLREENAARFGINTLSFGDAKVLFWTAKWKKQYQKILSY